MREAPPPAPPFAAGAGGAPPVAPLALPSLPLEPFFSFTPSPLCSIALGAVEVALTPRDQSKAAWPADLPATVEALAAAFDAFVDGVAGNPALAGAPSAAAKVKAVADAVWAKLQKGYSKDLQHAQVGGRSTGRLLCVVPPAAGRGTGQYCARLGKARGQSVGHVPARLYPISLP